MMNNPNMNGAPAPNPAFIPQVPLELPHYGCSFTESIKRFFLKYAVFKGRASRSEFWYAQLFLVLVSLAFEIFDKLLGGGLGTMLILLQGIWNLAVLVPGIAITVRRLHDSGKSGYWWFAAYGPIIGGTLFMVAGAGTAVINVILSRGGSIMPGAASIGLFLVGVLAYLAGFIIYIVLMVASEKPEGMRFDGPIAPMPGAVYGPPAGMANQPGYGPAQPMPQQPYSAGNTQQPSQPQQAYQTQQSGQPNYGQQTANQPQQPFGQPQQSMPWPSQQPQPSVPLPNQPVEQQQRAAYTMPPAQPQTNGFSGQPFRAAEQPNPTRQPDQYPLQPSQTVPQPQPWQPQAAAQSYVAQPEETQPEETQPAGAQTEETRTEETQPQESSPYEPIQAEPQQTAEGPHNEQSTSSDASLEANNTEEQTGSSPTADEAK